jgi:hypothetical protein
MSQATATHRRPATRAHGGQRDHKDGISTLFSDTVGGPSDTGDREETTPAPGPNRVGRHRSDARVERAGLIGTRVRRAGPPPTWRLIVLGFAIALVLGLPTLWGSPVTRSLAWVGVAVGGVFVGVGTVAAGVRLGLRWFDDRS